MKKLIEKRALLKSKLATMLDKAKAEERAFTADETAEFDKIEAEIISINNTIEAEERAKNISDIPVPAVTSGKNTESIEKVEERAFYNYLMGKSVEMRAGEQNMTMGNNGAVIPVTISNRIIKTVKELCPILAKATIYNIKGTLKIPVWGKSNTTHDISVGYQTEFTEITADSGKFTSIDLGGYLAGALVLVGKSVINNGSFDIVNFVITQMAEEIAAFLEKELLTGSGTNAAQGAVNTSNTLTAASATAISTDELIALQSKVAQPYQANSCWTMSSSAFLKIKQLKDADGRYLIQNDITSEFPYRLLGKPVYISENMADIAASAKTVLYGDYSGLSVNFRENVSIEVLREKYATQHAVGINAWFEFDSKVTDNQKLAVLVMKAS